MASDRYVHHLHAHEGDQIANLLALARHLAMHAESIEAHGGLSFDPDFMQADGPAPEAIAGSAATALPPLAHGPLAGIAPIPGEGWAGYCGRAFGIGLSPGDPFRLWIQSPLWEETEPSAAGAALRIAYLLDYGAPHDHVEIAMGQAWTDYDRNGFLWERLALPGPLPPRAPPRAGRDWPKWVGTVEQERRRAAITADAGNLRRMLVEHGIAGPEEIVGLAEDEIRALEATTGPMPLSYRQVLSLIGRSAGRLVDRAEFQIFIDQLEEVTRMGREQREGWRSERIGDPAPADAIFIGARHGGSPWFILPEYPGWPARGDSPVFLLDSDTGRVRLAAISVWEWVDSLVTDAAYWIGKEGAQRAVGPAHSDRLSRELAAAEEKRRARDRGITVAMMAGAALFGAALYGLRLLGV